MNGTALASPPPMRLTPRLVIDAWRSITRWQLLTTFLLGCAWLLLGMIAGASLGMG
jgi:hypothetical protein